MRALLLAAGLCLFALPALAEPFQGCLTADTACPATRSIRNAASDPAVALTPGEQYQIRARNRLDPTHYQIRVPGASPADRWVEVRCGAVEPGPCPGMATAAEPPAQARPDGQPADWLLAINWQPGFCETRPEKPECAGLKPGGFAAEHFSLHGLWPQPRGLEYCGVPEDQKATARSHGDAWNRLPALTISDETRAALHQVMPGSRSSLDRYEWLKHGTCSGLSQEDYHKTAVALIGQANTSALRDLFAGSVGKHMTLLQVRETVDAAFGAGAGARVAMSCRKVDGRNLIIELRLNLGTPLSPGSDLGAALRAGPPARGRSCERGEIDSAGP